MPSKLHGNWTDAPEVHNFEDYGMRPVRTGVKGIRMKSRDGSPGMRQITAVTHGETSSGGVHNAKNLDSSSVITFEQVR
jgi:hypothetical protein